MAREVPDEYDHDRISIHDLMELGITVGDFGPGDVKLPVAEATPDMPGDGLVPPPSSESVSTTAEAVEQASLLSRARSYDFQGLTAGPTLPGYGHVATAMLRWQDERSQRLRQEFPALAVDDEGQLHANPSLVVSWFLEPMDTECGQVDRDSAREVHDNIEQFIDNQLARESNANLHPENRERLGAAWCRGPAVDEGRGAP